MVQGGGMASKKSAGVRIAVVGDVHDLWDPFKDEKALQFIEPDLVLFTGDFGEENVELVKDVSCLNFPKAVILGNHDSWWTIGPVKRYTQIEDGRTLEPGRVKLQLDVLGESHVGYGRLDFPNLGLSVIGGRPFSCGGKKIWSQGLLARIYGVSDLKQSAQRIIEQASTAPYGHSLIFLCHNGPTGLGSKCNDICGKDWISKGGDHGDSDLQEALADVQKNHKRNIPLVVFGHMHKFLQCSLGDRTMLVHGEDGIVYLNGAVVPRVRNRELEESRSKAIATLSTRKNSRSEVAERHFTVVDLVNSAVVKISENWVSVGEYACQTREKILFSSDRLR